MAQAAARTRDVAASGSENQVLTLDVMASGVGFRRLTSVDQRDPSRESGSEVVTLQSGAKIWIQDGKVMYDPGSAFDYLAAGAKTTDTFVYSTRGGGLNTATVTVTITGANDGPRAVADGAFTSENQAVIIDALANDVDVDQGATLSLLDASVVAGKVTIEGGKLLYDPGEFLNYIPAGVKENVTISYRMQDEFGATSSSIVTLTVTGVNDAAVISGTASGTVTEDSPAKATGVLKIADADEGENSFQAGQYEGSYGTLTLSSTGSWEYSLDNEKDEVQALDEGDSESDAIVIKAADGTEHTITIKIEGADDGPSVILSAVSRGIANGNHWHTDPGVIEVGNWGGETVRGAVEFDISSGDFDWATLVFDFTTSNTGVYYPTSGTAPTTIYIYAYAANGSISYSDFSASQSVLVGTISAADFQNGKQFQIDVTDEFAAALAAGTELGFLFTYGDGSAPIHFTDFELWLG